MDSKSEEKISLTGEERNLKLKGFGLEYFQLIWLPLFILFYGTVRSIACKE